MALLNPFFDLKSFLAAYPDQQRAITALALDALSTDQGQSTILQAFITAYANIEIKKALETKVIALRTELENSLAAHGKETRSILESGIKVFAENERKVALDGIERDASVLQTQLQKKLREAVKRMIETSAEPLIYREVIRFVTSNPIGDGLMTNRQLAAVIGISIRHVKRLRRKDRLESALKQALGG